MIYIPLEIFSREYRSKLSVAVNMCAKGVPICIGHKSFVTSLYKSNDIPGIIYNKGVGDEVQKLDYEKSLEAGFKFVAQDEEAGIIFRNYKDFYNERTSLSDLKQVSKLLTWGPSDQKFLKENSLTPEKITGTGSPRASFWGNFGRSVFDKEIEAIKKIYGSFILFPTNFATYNSFLDPKSYDNHLNNFAYYRNGGHQELIDRDQYRYEFEMMEFVATSINAISSKFPQNIVIRPHPSEGFARWKKILSNFPKDIQNKVFLIRKGDVTPWILAADLVVQRGCTTGLEALLSDVPVVSHIHRDWKDQDPKRGLIDDNTINAETVDDLLDLVRGVCVEKLFLRNETFYNNACGKVFAPGVKTNILTIADEIIDLHNSSGFTNNAALKKMPLSQLQDLARIYIPRRNKTVAI